MSALNVKVGFDRVTLWTDGACTKDDGTLAGVISKVQPVPHLGGVFAVLGDPRVGILMAGYMADHSAKTSGDVVRHMREALQACSQQLPKFRGTVCVFAAWSEHSNTPMACMVSSIDMPGIKAFWVTTVEELTAPPVREAFSDMTQDPIAIMESQRGNMEGFSGRKPYHGIGGFIQETVVTREGISMRLIKRWDDKIGQRIEP